MFPEVRHRTCLAYTAFSGMWAIATIFHVASTNSWGHSLYQSLMTFSAIWLLCRPSSIPRLLLLATLQVYAAAMTSPEISNHWLFTAFVNVTIIVAYIFLMFRTQSFAIDRETLLRTFAPLVRIDLLVLYFFVVLHKLNTDWFSPELSCASAFYVAQVDRLPALSRLPVLASPHLGIAVEAAIPLLLWFHRTRFLGVWMGLVFHGLLALNPHSGFYNFSSMLCAVLVLFLPEDRLVQLQTWMSRSELRTRVTRLTAPSFSWRALLLYAVFAAAGLLLLTVLSRSITRRSDVFLPFWIVYCVTLMALLGMLGTITKTNNAPRYGVFTVGHPGLLWLPLLVFVNGLSPYLGLKTELAFSMFSNLRTEGRQSNHLFIPASIQIFDFQHDLVEVINSSDQQLQHVADQKLLIPYFELVRRNPMPSGTFIRLSRDSSSSGPPPLVLRKLFRFRPIDKLGGQKCRH